MRNSYKILDKSIEYLNLTPRIRNILYKHSITTILDLAELTEQEAKQIGINIKWSTIVNALSPFKDLIDELPKMEVMVTEDYELYTL